MSGLEVVPPRRTRLWIGARTTSLTDAKDRAATRSSIHRRRQRRTRTLARIVPSRRTDSKAGAVRLCVLTLGLSVIASATPGVGDGPQPHRLRSPRSREVEVSYAAIAAVLARHDLSAGERLVAWSLASFANRDQRAWPGIPAAAARAGLSRSRYLEAPRPAGSSRPTRNRDARRRARTRQHSQAPVRAVRSVAGGRGQRRAARGRARLQPDPRTCTAAAGRAGSARR